MLPYTPKRGKQPVNASFSNVARVSPEDIGKIEEWSWKGPFKRADIDDTPYTKIKHVKHPVYTAVTELGQLVGSKLKRDIKRHDAFISPKAFEAWNATTGKNRYVGDWEDIDGDEDPTEFVVRRKRFNKDGTVKVDEHGNEILSAPIAVNGWSTIKSDYPIRKQYFDEYPTADERAESKGGTPYYKYLENHYLTDDMKGRSGLPNHKYIDKRRIDTNASWQYNLRMPNPTARQLFMKTIIYPAFRFTIQDIAEQFKLKSKDVLDAIKGPGLASKIGTTAFNRWVKVPYMNAMIKEGYIVRKKQEYNNKISAKARNSPNYAANFEKWLFKLDSVREGLNDIVFDIISDKDEVNNAIFELYQIMYPKIMKSLNKSVSESPPMDKESVRRNWQRVHPHAIQFDEEEYENDADQ